MLFQDKAISMEWPGRSNICETRLESSKRIHFEDHPDDGHSKRCGQFLNDPGYSPSMSHDWNILKFSNILGSFLNRFTKCDPSAQNQ